MLTTAAALPLGNIIMFSYQLVARGHERDSLLPFGVGAVATIGGGLVAVAAAGPRVDLVAAALVGGQLLAQALLALRLVRRSPELRSAAAQSTVVAALVVLLACASLAEALRRAGRGRAAADRGRDGVAAGAGRPSARRAWLDA